MRRFSRKRHPAGLDAITQAKIRALVAMKYGDVWRDQPYARRHNRIEDAIARVEAANAWDDKVRAAGAAMRSRAEAERFAHDVSEGQHAQLRARMIIETHHHRWHEALHSCLQEQEVTIEQVFPDDESYIRTQAKCLGAHRSEFDPGIWAALRQALTSTVTGLFLAQHLPE